MRRCGSKLLKITITWANVDPDLCRHMASLGHNELNAGNMMNIYGNHWMIAGPDIVHVIYV